MSDECRNCYAEIQAARWSGPGQPYDGLAENTPSGPRWTGAIRVIEDHLDDPLRWRKGQLVFVNSMSDLFYEPLPDRDVFRIMARMALAPRQTFQVLTKRPARMQQLLRACATDRKAEWHDAIQAAMDTAPKSWKLDGAPYAWPLPNVWWGTSVGSQKSANLAMDSLVACRQDAAVLWVSAEPLIAPMSLVAWLDLIDWLVVGGESQEGCRPMDLTWARELKAEAGTYGVAFHMKQLGGDPDPRKKLDDLPPDLRVRDYPTITV